MKHLTRTALSALLCAAATLAAQATHAADKPAKPAAPKEMRTLSGILVKLQKEGQGAQAKASDTVTVHYRGTLADGKEFDSSYKRGEPTAFPLNRVIPCWTEGIQLLKVGSKATLVCPPELAYGSRGIPGVIPPNATLTFEVELLGIDK
ncbi:MAG TPA: FKBP-type peptidyl-prolyl cis-trans isomerase [Rhodocyclaceae bacterium]|nr:FKBP-type peptidyl-prolyl cis-trans isomerase [Rhodocyclaceae bacterium]